MISSRVVLICFLFLLLSCSTKHKSAADNYAEASLKTGALVQRYGQIIGEDQRRYLNTLEIRLRSNLPNEYKRENPFTTILLDAGKPLAYSPGAGFIVLSRGMIESLDNEAQLAFVYAHEMAHYYLDHEYAATDDESDYNVKQELAADKMALGIISMAGYDPNQSIVALKKIYSQARQYIMQSSTYPDIMMRVRQLNTALEETGKLAAGIVDTRDFRKFKVSI